MAILNFQQKKAVQHLKGPLLVLAGAGSGKTRVITFRNKFLLENGINHKHILNLTFTQKAAKEMSQRIGKYCQDILPPKKKIFTTTFHSFGLYFLKRNIKKINYLPNVSIQTMGEQKEIITNILKEKKITFDLKILKDVMTTVSVMKNNFGQVKNFSGNFNIKEIYKRYNQFLKNYNMVDFDDLLLLPYEILKKDKLLREKLQRTYRYVMVDEFQDTNLLQYGILKLLLSQEKNIVVVGDDDQSIYSWRGAEINNILQFEKSFPSCKMIKLEENFRSTNNLVSLANHFIKKNQNRREKKLFSQLISDKKTSINELKNDQEEAKFVCESIQFKRFKNNLPYSNVAVLYRTKKQSKLLESYFLRYDIPHRVWGKKGFFERKEVKDVMALGKLLVNLNDSLSFLRVINLRSEIRIREKNLSQLRNLILVSDLKLMEIVENEEFQNLLNQNEKKELDYFINIIKNYADHTKNLRESFNAYLNDIEYLDYLEKQKEEKEVREDKFKRIDYFLNLFDYYQKRRKKKSFQSFFLDLLLNLNNQDDEDFFNKSEVSLMTIHAVKGLEFDYVYLIGVEEDLIPYYHAESNSINQEEERRLFYVALTRAKKECIISYALERKFNHKMMKVKPSPFLQDLPSQYIVRNFQKSSNFSVDGQEDNNTNKSKEKGFLLLREALNKR